MKRIIAIMALVLFSACGTGPRTQPFQGSVYNFGKVDGHTYRGTQPYTHDYQGLKDMGVKTILDLRNDPEEYSQDIAERVGLNYINVPMSSHTEPSILSIQAALTVIRNKENWPVYVHCEGGRHRTGVVIATYRVKDYGWSKTKAWAEAYKYDYYRGLNHGSIEDWFLQEFNPNDLTKDEK